MRKLFFIICIIFTLSFVSFGCAAKTADISQTSANSEQTQSEEIDRSDEPAGNTARKESVREESGSDESDEEVQSAEEPSAAKSEETGVMDEKATPSKNGKLSVSGTALIDEHGNEVQLKGISTHGLSWFPEYVNQECFNELSENFGANVIRLAMYTAESGGYNTDGSQEELKQLVKDGVNYAKEADMYAVIDWHTLSDSDPNTYLEEAKEFFAEMSEEFADYDNVIYEICNEPNNGTTWEQIKSYAENVIPVIRTNDEDAVILIGTPNWCQYIEEAASDPVDFENIMYTVHYYAATHKEDLREKVREAHEVGLPIFISEYGICDASGNGAIDYEQAQLWDELKDELNISSVMWNLSNKDETSAIISSGCTKTSGFSEDDLSDAGKWIVSVLNGETAQPASSGNKPENSDNSKPSEMNIKGEAGSLDISVDVVNSWEENGKIVNQYQLNLKNNGEDIESWSVVLEFDGDFAYKDGWNASFKASGDTLAVENADYNGSLKSGTAISDVGFIIAGEGKIINAS